MKLTELTYKIFLAFFLLTLVILPACSDDDDSGNMDGNIVGKWTIHKVTDISTDNTVLNLTLPVVFSQQGIEITSSTYTFDADNMAHFYIPIKDKSPVQYAPAYAYENNQLAFRFDEILPIPFNAFDVLTLSDKRLELRATISAESLKILLELIKLEDPTIGATVESLLADSLKKGLTITLNLSRVEA
ncbi:hypothetical protein D0T51_03285 [Parabacteroides sp. 52]|uniref:hypothetical protein n=1 Tax=unclassified Parabacteroides TaxID=2649774 RepID=UPI0013D64C2E|nr:MULTISPECIES: hypothetical protein [unclassified Parabacteroides]MDH6534015.1 hypothetical protein [Parabacteroides sp. PM5-20]NDV54756.1 hypothetical protein [Parabacteroides sp. 52]